LISSWPNSLAEELHSFVPFGASVDVTDARFGQVLNENQPTGKNATGSSSFKLRPQDTVETFSGVHGCPGRRFAKLAEGNFIRSFRMPPADPAHFPFSSRIRVTAAQRPKTKMA
jgi:hypothetical protein